MGVGSNIDNIKLRLKPLTIVQKVIFVEEAHNEKRKAAGDEKKSWTSIQDFGYVSYGMNEPTPPR